MEEVRPILVTAVFIMSVLWWHQPCAAQENAPQAAPGTTDAAILKRLQDLEQKVQYLQQRLDEKEKTETAATPKVEEQVRRLGQKVEALEREKKTEKDETEAKAKEAPVISLKDGFTVKTPDDKFKVNIGGWVLYDFASISESRSLQQSVGKELDATGFRSARLRVGGTVYSNIDYQLEVDFVGKESNAFNSPAFYDTYLQVHGLPSLGGDNGRLRVGHFREPFSMEELTSLPRLTFLERSLADVFAPSRNVGIQWSDALLGDPGHERLTYALGVFKSANTFATGNASGYSVTGRVTGLPWYENEGEHLLHLGAAFSHRETNGAVLGWNARPESRLTQFRYANADSTAPLFRLRDARVETVDEAGLEAAFVHGPFSVQGEYEFANVGTTFDGIDSFSGYYAQVGYFLTGEHREYRHADGLLAKVAPKHNFGLHSGDGWGAWEVAARYSGVDLDDGGVRGGRQNNTTLGVNWFLNPNARLTLNYIHGDVKHDLYKGGLDVVQMRFGVDF